MKQIRQMIRALSRAVVLVMILVMTGGHWMILQSVAWTKMIIEYSRSAPLGVALEQTFDGWHPCQMCKMIQKAKQPAKQQELQQRTAQDDVLFAEAHSSSSFDLPSFRTSGTSGFVRSSWCDPPPVPPPKLIGCS